MSAVQCLTLMLVALVGTSHCERVGENYVISSEQLRKFHRYGCSSGSLRGCDGVDGVVEFKRVMEWERYPRPEPPLNHVV